MMRQRDPHKKPPDQDLELRLIELTKRLERLERSYAHTLHRVDDIYGSRIWRILSFLGSIVLRLERLYRRAALPASAPSSHPAELLIYPEFPPTDRVVAVRGIIEVRGRIVALCPLRAVTIHIDDIPVTDLSLLQSPSASTLSDVNTYTYTGLFDSRVLPEGKVSIRVTATSSVEKQSVSITHVEIDPSFRIEYKRWISSCERDGKWSALAAGKDLLSRPLFSIACPVYRPAPTVLIRCIESVLSQSYQNWELLLVDDGSDNPDTSRILRGYASQDARIKVWTRPSNGGISAATNDALRESRGHWITFLDCDDELAAPHALDRVVDAINRNPDVAVFYSDEDKINEKGHRYEPFFKPDWSPDLLLSCNYICHLVIIRKDIVERVGFLDESYTNGAQDYDYLLRVTECTQKIRRISAILYHWRAGPGSTAGDPLAKPGASGEGRRALGAYLERTCPGAVVDETTSLRYRVRYPIAACERVSIIISAGGNVELLSASLESIIGKTTYRNFEVVVIDNSTGSEVQQLVNRLTTRGVTVRLLDFRNESFNYSALNNRAVRHTDSPFIVFLNDDVVVREPEWLSSMLEHSQRPEIGVVGALLLYPNGSIQHAGVVMGIGGICDHVFKGGPPNPDRHFGLPLMIRNVSAVTAACAMVRRSVFEQVGGFDEEHLPVVFQDIDLCLRINEFGYRILITPHACLYHHESATRGDGTADIQEIAWMQHRWKSLIADDPFYNPNLTRADHTAGLRFC